MHITKSCIRGFPGNPVHKPVILFSLPSKGEVRRYLTLPYGNEGMKYVLVGTTNPVIAEYICQEYGREIVEDVQPVTVCKHLAEVIQMDFVNLIGMACDRVTAEIEWDCYYYTPPAVPVQIARAHIM